MSIQQTTLQLIPLNQLTASPRNVRRKDRKADIDALAASIASRGLLQNLCVVPTDAGKYEVDAGGRRLHALKLLAKTGVIPKDFPVACNVVAPAEGREVSLVENVHRVAMDAMDEVGAYAALIADGSTPDEIARRFGVERRHVEQRLALANLSPKIKAAWKRGDISLDAARAFCLVQDHAQQDAVFRSLGKPVTHASSVRARLMDGRVRATDRLATFVSLSVYEASGGKLLRDLFDEEAVFIESPALLMKLAEDKLTACRDQWLSMGWSWVDINLGTGRAEGLASTRLQPEWRDPTPEEQAELDRISAEIEALDSALEADSVDDDPRWSQRDDLEAAYETIRQAGRCWTQEVLGLSGVVLSISHDGEVSASEGLVRADDLKRVEAYLKRRRAGESDDGNAEDAKDQPDRHTSALPKAVNRDLTLARTRAIRVSLAGDPDIALAVCVAAIAARTLHRTEMTGVAISGQMRTVEDLSDLESARAELEGQVPSDDIEMLHWALDLSRERLLGVLSILVAGAIDLAHEDTSPVDLRKQAVADCLAQQLDIDMTSFWSPGIDFWARLPKAVLISAMSEAPSMADRSARAREDAIKAHAKLRKDELAVKVGALFEGANYLPDILVTPVEAGGLALTEEGAALIATLAVAAE